MRRVVEGPVATERDSRLAARRVQDSDAPPLNRLGRRSRFDGEWASANWRTAKINPAAGSSGDGACLSPDLGSGTLVNRFS